MQSESTIKKFEFFKKQNLSYAYDSLTKVLNREIILTYVKYLIQKNIPFTLGLADLDNFKYVNDTYGHMMGDIVLSKFADVLTDSIGDKGVVGRYSGDEFIIVLENISEYNDVWEIFHNNNLNVAKIVFENAEELTISMTTGISRFPLDDKTYEGILGTADKALYRGKMKGRNCFIIYLAAKHSKIMLQSGNEKSFSSMTQISKIFDIMESEHSIKDNIEGIVQFFSTYFMMEHVCIQDYEKILYDVVHPLAPEGLGFKYIDTNSFKDNMNQDGLFFVNNRRSLLQVRSVALHKGLKDQNVNACIAVDIRCKGIDYGVIRIDACNINRVWQTSEMDLLVVSARLIANTLYSNHISLKELFEKE